MNERSFLIGKKVIAPVKVGIRDNVVYPEYTRGFVGPFSPRNWQFRSGNGEARFGFDDERCTLGITHPPPGTRGGTESNLSVTFHCKYPCRIYFNWQWHNGSEHPPSPRSRLGLRTNNGPFQQLTKRSKSASQCGRVSLNCEGQQGCILTLILQTHDQDSITVNFTHFEVDGGEDSTDSGPTPDRSTDKPIH